MPASRKNACAAKCAMWRRAVMPSGSSTSDEREQAENQKDRQRVQTVNDLQQAAGGRA